MLFSCIFGSKRDSFWLNLAWKLFHVLVSFWVDPSTTAWEKGLVKCHMSASQVLNAPTTLAPNDALQEPNFCNQCKPWKLIDLDVLLKTFTQLTDARKSRFAPNTPDLLCANYTRHLKCFARNGTIQRCPHPWHRLSLKFGSSFVIEIQTHARTIEFERIC